MGWLFPSAFRQSRVVEFLIVRRLRPCGMGFKMEFKNIKIDLNIKLGDIAVKNKRKIKLKRNINGKIETTSF